MSETQREAVLAEFRRELGAEVVEVQRLAAHDLSVLNTIFRAGWDARSAALPSREQVVEALLRSRMGFLWRQANEATVVEALRDADVVLSLLSGKES